MSAEPGAYRTVPRGYVYADHIPYVTPDSLDDLRGPASGVMTVGPHIDTSLNPTYDLDTGDRTLGLYSATVRDGVVPDHIRVLNRSLLLRLWPDLNLPTRCRVIWESTFPELTARADEIDPAVVR